MEMNNISTDLVGVEESIYRASSKLMAMESDKNLDSDTQRKLTILVQNLATIGMDLSDIRTKIRHK